MTVFDQRLEIGSLFTAWNSLRNDDGTLILVNVEGWDAVPEIQRNTRKRLFGDGDYYSSIATFASKTVVFTMQIAYPDDQSIRGVRSNIRQIAQAINAPQTLTMTYYEDGVETFKEVLSGLPAPDLFDEWQPMENSVTFSISFYIPDPWKTVFLNGSTTAETQKRI